MLRQVTERGVHGQERFTRVGGQGCGATLVELAEEARAIFAAFPELREQGRGFGSQREVATEQVKLSKRRRKGKSAAARKKVSLRSEETVGRVESEAGED